MAAGRILGKGLFCSLLILPAALVAAPQNSLEAPAANESALALSNRLQQQRALLDEQIAALESQYGPFDFRLQEPLQSLTDLLIEAGDFEEVDRQLGRRLQLIRSIEGPATLNQVALIAERIANDTRLQRWQSIGDHYELIRSLHGQNDTDVALRLDAMNALRHWHLSAIYLDTAQRRVNHFLDARNLLREMLAQAEDEYGQEAVELIPLLYARALDQYRVVAFITSIDELGDEAREAIIAREGRGWESYLLEAADYIHRIQDIVASMGDPEAAAMTMLYLADFQMLRREMPPISNGGRALVNSRGIAGRTYTRAIDMLAEAGVEEGLVEEYFAQPVILPVPQLHLALDAALAHRRDQGYTSTDPEQGDGEAEPILHLGDFLAWNESLPFSIRPATPAYLPDLDTQLNTVELKLTLNSIGKTRSPTVLSADPDSVQIRREARDALKDMQFRPVRRDGRWRRIRDVTIRYLYPPPK